MAGLIPQPFIDEVLQRTDLVELIDGYVPLKKRGNSYVACCPFHNEKSPSFNVVAKKQFYHCFGCGASGNAISFVMNHLNQSFLDAIETLASRVGLAVPRDGQATRAASSNTNLYQLLSDVSAFYQAQLKDNGAEAVSYLKSRGLSGEIAKRYELGFAPDGWHTLEKQFPKLQKELISTGMLVQNDDGKIYDRYRNRIMFPIHDRQGRIIGFGGRVLQADQKPKYLNSPETALFQKGRELYGLHQVITCNKTIECILVVEGYMDVIALAQHGIPFAVATLGTATSTFHIQLLAKYSKRVIFCFDGDQAGRQAAWRALESCIPYLNLGVDASFTFLPEQHDPDSLVREEGREGFIERLKKATPLHRFFLSTLSSGINLSTIAGKTQLIEACKPYLQKMDEGPYKALLTEELSRMTHIETHRLQEIIKDAKALPLIEKAATITRTPLRIAIAILLQNPEIFANHADKIHENRLNPQEHAILIRLIQQLKAQPKINTASLVELWRDNDHFESIVRLATWEHLVPEQELAREFVDTVLFLQKQNHEREIRQYIEKSRSEGLNQEEQAALMTLLKQRHQDVAL